MADSQAMTGAPVSPSEPPHTTTVPEANFEPPAERRGTPSRTAGRIRPSGAPPGAPAGIPMSTTSTAPACSFPGAITSPGLAAWNVRVVVAHAETFYAAHVERWPPLRAAAADTGAAPAA